MKNLIKLFYCVLPFSFITFFSFAQKGDFCGVRNSAFMPGEKIVMKVYYNAMGAYIGAGEASFTTAMERFNGKPVYHCIGEGKTYLSSSFSKNVMRSCSSSQDFLNFPGRNFDFF